MNKKKKWLRTGIHIPAEHTEIWQSIPNKSEFIRKALLAYSGTKFLKISLPKEIYDDLATLANQKNMSIEDYIIQHICLELHGNAVRCPNCDRPLILAGEILEDTIQMQCPFCLHEWTYQN